MIKRIDTLSYANSLRSLSPMWKCGFAAVLFILAYVSHPAVQLMMFGWLLAWTVVYARIPLRFYTALLGASCVFFAASLPAMVVELQRTGATPIAPRSIVLLSTASWTVFITETGLQMAARLLCRIAVCLSCLSFVILTTPVSELFQVMRRLRVPSLVLELMLITYRFLFLLLETTQALYTAQRARGGQSGFKSRLHDTAILIVRLFGKTMERYQGLSHGLVARGFTDEIRMAPYEAKPVPFRYRWEGIIGIAILASIEIWLRWRQTA